MSYITEPVITCPKANNKNSSTTPNWATVFSSISARCVSSNAG